jgi:hypothetical protein
MIRQTAKAQWIDALPAVLLQLMSILHLPFSL